jgi:hypothetical protein
LPLPPPKQPPAPQRSAAARAIEPLRGGLVQDTLPSAQRLCSAALVETAHYRHVRCRNLHTYILHAKRQNSTKTLPKAAQLLHCSSGA